MSEVIVGEKADLSCNFVYDLLLRLACIRVEYFFWNFRIVLIVGTVRVIRNLLFFRFFQETRGLQLHDALNLPGREAFSLGPEALDGDELLSVNLLGPTELIGSTIVDLQSRICLVCQQNEL